jgi:HEAT repeat protein
MSKTLESLRQEFQSEDFGVRLHVLIEGRNLDLADRYELIALATSDPHSRVRYDAVSQLSSIGQYDLIRSSEILLDRLANDPEGDVRAAAADSIGALKLAGAFEALQDAYQRSTDWIMQFSIIAALGELGDRRSFDLLTNALEHSNELIRIAAVGSLGELGDPRAVELILPLVENPDWQIRHRVAQALANLGGAEAEAALIGLTQDPSPQVADIARSLLSVSAD